MLYDIHVLFGVTCGLSGKYRQETLEQVTLSFNVPFSNVENLFFENKISMPKSTMSNLLSTGQIHSFLHYLSSQSREVEQASLIPLERKYFLTMRP